MINIKEQDCLSAGVHIGHLTKRWDPHMAPYIFMESNGRHILDVKKTISQLQVASDSLYEIVASGEKVLFVSTKKQFKDYVTELAKSLNMPCMTEKWFGGTLTNFITVRKLIKKINSKDKMISSPLFKFLAKKEQLVLIRKNDKLKKNLAGILSMMRLPGAIIVVDMKKDCTAVREARKLAIPVFSLVDTNSNPTLADYPIPANDDLVSSVKLILDTLKDSIERGLNDFKSNVVTVKDEEDATVEDEEKKPRGDRSDSKRSFGNRADGRKLDGKREGNSNIANKVAIEKKPVIKKAVSDINLTDKSKLKNVLSGNKQSNK